MPALAGCKGHIWRFFFVVAYWAFLCSPSNGAACAKATGLEPGDIVFGDSEGVWTGLGYDYAKSKFGIGVGHAGIYIGEKNGVHTVVHVGPGFGVEEMSLEAFPVKGSYLGARTTYPPPTPEQRKKIVEYAERAVGKPYARLPWQTKGPNRFNCTGLTESAYEYAGLNPTPWWLGDMPFRFVWPIEQFYSPNVQCAVYGEGPIISSTGAILARLWMTYGYTILWLFLVTGILYWRRRRRAKAVKLKAIKSKNKMGNADMIEKRSNRSEMLQI